MGNTSKMEQTNIWIFSGLEHYRAVHSSFLVILLVAKF